MMGAHHAACGAAAWVAIASDYEVPVTAVTEPMREAVRHLVAARGGPHRCPADRLRGLDRRGGALRGGDDGRGLPASGCRSPQRDTGSLPAAVLQVVRQLRGDHIRWSPARHARHLRDHRFHHRRLLPGVLSASTPTTSLGPFHIGTVNIGAGLITVILCALAFKALKFMPDSARKAPWAAAIPFGVFSMFVFPSEAHWLALVVGSGLSDPHPG